jgi:methyl-accepting chemotaxis protein
MWSVFKVINDEECMKRLISNLKLSQKLRVTPTVLVGALLLFGLIGFWGLRSQQGALGDIFNVNYKATRNAALVTRAAVEAQGNTYKLISWARANYDGAKIEALGKSELARIDQTIPLLKSLADSSVVPELKDKYGKAQQQLVDYRKAVANVVDFAGFDLNTATMAMATAEDKYSALSATLGEAENLEALAGKASFDDATTSYGRVVVLFLVVLVGAIVITVLVTLWINAMILAPIRVTTEVIGVVAGGDLTREVPLSTKDEIGDMARQFNGMVVNLRSLLREISLATNTIASATTQISSSTEQMAAGAHEQTAQTGEVASAVEEMTRTIQENSNNAIATAETAKNAKQAAEQGGKVVEETVSGMQKIAHVVNTSARTVQELGKSSNQIGEIIGVIDDIADQTNLLALNAAIEAARAGEQGRGFAVVADEVRKLAERTSKATKEIAVMIKKIQSDTKDAVAAMDEGTSQVDNGIKLADRAGTSLQDIMRISQKVTDMVTQIASASEQQSAASEQISKNIESISTVTGETASGTQQIARAAEDLNRLTDNLQKLLTKFDLGERREGVSELPRQSQPSETEWMTPAEHVHSNQYAGAA